MKRTGNLFDFISDRNNVRLAFLKAIKGKRKTKEVILFCKNIDKNLTNIENRLKAPFVDWSSYKSFKITDPKERIIRAAPLSDRIMHHAIMNILEPVFEKQFIYHCYACRKGKGVHSAVLYAFRKCKNSPWFIKLDIKKYFDSINHLILKEKLARLIKDSKVLMLLGTIIDSYNKNTGTGLPIGNLTSQFFANLYLSSLDYFILHKIKPEGYVRYMDDFVLWVNKKELIKPALKKIGFYVNENLKLQLKTPVVGKTKDGLPFLGFLIKNKGIYLLKKSKRRMKKGAKSIYLGLKNGRLSEDKASIKAQSIDAAVSLARTRSFRAILWKGMAVEKSRL